MGTVLQACVWPSQPPFSLVLGSQSRCVQTENSHSTRLVSNGDQLGHRVNVNSGRRVLSYTEIMCLISILNLPHPHRLVQTSCSKLSATAMEGAAEHSPGM